MERLKFGCCAICEKYSRISHHLAQGGPRIFRYAGATRSETETPQEQSGIRGYAVGFDPLIGYVNKRLPKNEVITRSFRVTQAIYPEIAIREFVANALLHQDMTISGTGPLIELFSDRVEIANPGKPLVDTSR